MGALSIHRNLGWTFLSPSPSPSDKITTRDAHCHHNEHLKNILQFSLFTQQSVVLYLSQSLSGCTVSQPVPQWLYCISASHSVVVLYLSQSLSGCTVSQPVPQSLYCISASPSVVVLYLSQPLSGCTVSQPVPQWLYCISASRLPLCLIFPYLGSIFHRDWNNQNHALLFNFLRTRYKGTTLIIFRARTFYQFLTFYWSKVTNFAT